MNERTNEGRFDICHEKPMFQNNWLSPLSIFLIVFKSGQFAKQSLRAFKRINSKFAVESQLGLIRPPVSNNPLLTLTLYLFLFSALPPPSNERSNVCQKFRHISSLFSSVFPSQRNRHATAWLRAVLPGVRTAASRSCFSNMPCRQRGTYVRSFAVATARS